eukprot:scaffold998_cov162-Ochromonas_danica.AAC.10
MSFKGVHDNSDLCFIGITPTMISQAAVCIRGDDCAHQEQIGHTAEDRQSEKQLPEAMAAPRATFQEAHAVLQVSYQATVHFLLLVRHTIATHY